jgi:hypothetical protein
VTFPLCARARHGRPGTPRTVRRCTSSSVPLPEAHSDLPTDLTEGSGSRVRLFLGGVRAVFHRPHPEKEAGKGLVRDVPTHHFGILLHQPFARSDPLLVAFSVLDVDDRMFARPTQPSELTMARPRKHKLRDRKNRYIPENRQSPARQACLTLISGADHAFPLPSASGRCPAGWLRELLSCPISKARFKLRQ